MLGRLVYPEIQELIARGEDDTLRDVLNQWLPADLGQLLTFLTPGERVRGLRLLAPGLAAETFAYLDLDRQLSLLDSISQRESASLLNNMSPDDRTTLLAELSPDQADRMIALLAPDQREVARTLLTYDEDSVGRLMTPDYVAVRRDWTIRHVLDHVRAHGRDSETLNVIYVLDADHRLIDDLRIREILLAPFHAMVSDLCDDRFVSLKATDAKKDAVEVFRKYDRTALPVVDDRGRLVGIVTLDDVLDVAEEEATREIQMFGGLEALDEPYISTPAPPDGSQAGHMAGHPLRRRVAHRDGHGLLRARDRSGHGAGALRPPGHFQRWQLGLAGRHADHPRAGPGRGEAPRLVPGDAQGDLLGRGSWARSWARSASCGSPSGAPSRRSTASTGCWSD